MKNKKNISQADLLKEYFLQNPHKKIPHNVIVPWAVNEFKKRTGKVLADADRAIRKMSQQGFLVKEGKGVYKYDPNHIERRRLEDFNSKMKEAIFERDGYRCVICGRGPKEGFEIHADHIKAKDFGGEAILENGQTLCAPHNFLKKNSNQTETGKKLFIRLYELANKEDNKELLKFCSEILEVFEKNGINGHIEWKR